MTATETAVLETPIVYIIDDDAAIRKALKLVIESAGHQVEVFESAEEFLARKPKKIFDCLLLDLRLGGMSGLELLKHIRENNLQIPTLMITGHGDVPAAVMSMKLGAVEFLEKPLDNQILLQRITEGLEISRKLRHHRQQSDSLHNQFSTLSPRELEVLKLIIAGKSTKQIAFTTHLSQKTISNHRARLLSKTGADNTADMVRKALEAGIGQFQV